MSDGTPARYIMRQAMCEFYRGPERTLVDQFIMLEAQSRSDDPTMERPVRTIWSFMVAKAIGGQVRVTGHLEQSHTAQLIEPGLLANSQPDFDRQTLRTDIGTFYGVLVGSTAEAKGGTQPGAAAPVATTEHAGPEPRHGDDFIQEVLRVALTPDGFETRRQLESHMKDWCSRNRGDRRPDDRTIERWVKRYWPPELPAK